MNKTKYVSTIMLIKKCYNINFSIPKGYGTRSSNYSKYYNKKDILIKKIISNIKDNNLNIKYGIKEGVTYFCFEGRQFSFHGNYGTNKQYKGEWQGTRRKKLEKEKGKIVGKNDCYAMSYKIIN